MYPPGQAEGPGRVRKQRFNRKRTGCLTCRGRKVKCDELHPACQRCIEMGTICTWPPTPTSISTSSADHYRPSNISHATPSGSMASASTSTRDGDAPAEILRSNWGYGEISLPKLPVTTWEPRPSMALSIPPLSAYITPIDSQGSASSYTSSMVPRPHHTYLPHPIPQLLPIRPPAAYFPMLSTPSDNIENVFPSADSKRVFHHLRSRTSGLVVALAPANEPTRNPFMSLILRLVVEDQMNSAQTAFRHSLLSLGAAHVLHQYQHALPEQGIHMRTRSVKSRLKAMAHMSISLFREKEIPLKLLLVTSLTLFMRNNLYAETEWEESLNFALRIIMRRGGPDAILRDHDYGVRFLVEQLAVADVFSTFSTGKEPRFLGQGAEWYRDCGRSMSEWEAFERHLGMSRDMMELLAKSRILISRKHQQGPITSATPLVEQALREEANELLQTLRMWSFDQSSSTRKKRVMNGDSAYRYMIVISILTEILEISYLDPRIQMAVRSVLELCSEMSQEPLHLLWPLLYAGAFSVDQDRIWVKQLFSTFADYHCRNLIVAEELMLEQWTRLACGTVFRPWHLLMMDTGKKVCIM